MKKRKKENEIYGFIQLSFEKGCKHVLYANAFKLLYCILLLLQNNNTVDLTLTI